MTLVKCIALMAFTQFVPGYGQVHGDPDNSEAKEPEVPFDFVQKLIEENKVEAPDGWNAVEPETEATEPNFVAIHLGGGAYAISGVGLEAPERVKGKVAAYDRIAELEADLAKKAADEGDAPED